MRLSRIGRLFGFLCTLATFHVATVRAQSEPPEEVLKRAGLKRSGSSYVLAGEADVQRRMSAARLVSREMNVATMQQEAFEAGAQGQKVLVQQLTEQRLWLNEQLAVIDQDLNALTASSTPNFPLAMQRNQLAAQHNQLVAAINGLTDRINLLRNQEADPDLKRQIAAELSQKRGAYLEAILGLREAVDKTAGQYAELAKDDSVTRAISALGAKLKVKPPLKLGPSSQFLANVKLLERVEKSVLTDTIELSQEGGVYHVDVTLNGKVTVPFVFDTGASLTTISAELASRIGLEPRPDDRPLKLHVADGTVIDARQKTIPSVRVGRFTVNNVVCAVMPAGKTKAPLLLGQSFHRHFTYKFTPESRQLVLTKIDSMEPQPKSGGATKNSPRKKPARRQRGGTVDVPAAGSDSF
jgi:clan AA aspartic protease (TIGR02281 family)